MTVLMPHSDATALEAAFGSLASDTLCERCLSQVLAAEEDARLQQELEACAPR